MNMGKSSIGLCEGSERSFRVPVDFGSLTWDAVPGPCGGVFFHIWPKVFLGYEFGCTFNSRVGHVM